MVAVEFRLLGDIEAYRDDQPIKIGYAQLRSMLAVLLVEANHTVSVDNLIDRVWGSGRLPLRPRNAVQHNITLLRRMLATAGDAAIMRHLSGYHLKVDTDTVDVHRFHSLLERARAAEDEDTAAALFERAILLWRGEPFAGLDTPWLNSLRTTLDSQRQAAQRDLTDVHLRMGQHCRLLAELSDEAEAHPLDERLAGQYLLALYRSGHQAQALEYYQQIRRQLADQLGTDLSPPLQHLYQQILTADLALAAPTTRSTVSAAKPSVPRQLPAPPRLFTGRTNELAQLDQAVHAAPGAPVMISAICGIGGIGKTWLALHWAHQHLDRFPDGQLHVDLSGFDPSGEPMPTSTALRGFLVSLGVDPTAIPHDPHAQVGLYRSLVADKRMLIVLDNARNTAQLTPLLPGGLTCTVLVTSRCSLSGLATTCGAITLPLDVLSDAEARALLSARLGVARLTAEPDILEELVACCGGVPLALSIVAGRAEANPRFSLAELAIELRDATTRLGALNDNDPAASLPAVLSWSYDALTREQAQVFGLLGLVSGPDISLSAAASLTALPVGQVRAVLRELVSASLVQQHMPYRYRMHDLVRLYAAEGADRDLPAETRNAALRRVVDFYLHTAHTGNRLLDARRDPVDIGQPAAGTWPVLLPDQAAALAWFDAEHPCLSAARQLAIDQDWDRTVWQLALALTTFYWRRGHIDDYLAAWRAGLAAAERLGDGVTVALALQRLGHACARAGRYADATAHLWRAVSLAEEAGDCFGYAQAHRLLGWVYSGLRENQQALVHIAEALHLFRILDMSEWEAAALNQMGWNLAQLGRHEQASTHCHRALTLFRHHNDREGEAITLDSLGCIAHETGWYVQALSYCRQALAQFRDLGHSYYEAETLDHLASTHAALGNTDEAASAWQQALVLYQAQHRVEKANRIRRLVSEFR